MNPLCLSCPISFQQQISQDNNERITSDVINTVGVSLTLTVFSVIFGLFLYFRQKRPAYLCSEGLLLIPRKKVEGLRWDEVDEVYWSARKMAFLRKSSVDVGLHRSLLSDTHQREIIEIVEREVIPRLQAQAIAQYQTLGNVLFSCLAIGLDGISNNSPTVKWSMDERVVRWTDLEDISCEEGALFVKVKGQRKRWDGGPRSQRSLASIIPNPMIYAALAQHILEISINK